MEKRIFSCSDSSYIADFRCYSIMRSEIKLFLSHCLKIEKTYVHGTTLYLYKEKQVIWLSAVS